jgi:hypothetical protein
MKRFTRFVIGLAFVLGALYLGYKVKYPDYSYRYRLELTLEVDGKRYTGSSVIEVKWTGEPSIYPFGNYNAAPSVRGQAPIIDLGDRGIVIAALYSGGYYSAAIDALWIGPKAFGSDSSIKELPKLPELTGRRDLGPNGWPLLIFLPNRLDPNTLRPFKPNEAASIFGSGAHFSSAFVEITRDPVLVDIEKTLPWYVSWRDELLRKRGFSSNPQTVKLFPFMLVGGAF